MKYYSQSINFSTFSFENFPFYQRVSFKKCKRLRGFRIAARHLNISKGELSKTLIENCASKRLLAKEMKSSIAILHMYTQVQPRWRKTPQLMLRKCMFVWKVKQRCRNVGPLHKSRQAFCAILKKEVKNQFNSIVYGKL